MKTSLKIQKAYSCSIINPWMLFSKVFKGMNITGSLDECYCGCAHCKGTGMINLGYKGMQSCQYCAGLGYFALPIIEDYMETLCNYLQNGRMDYEMFVAEGKYLASQASRSDWATVAASEMRALYEFIAQHGTQDGCAIFLGEGV